MPVPSNIDMHVGSSATNSPKGRNLAERPTDIALSLAPNLMRHPCSGAKDDRVLG